MFPPRMRWVALALIPTGCGGLLLAGYTHALYADTVRWSALNHEPGRLSQPAKQSQKRYLLSIVYT